MWVEHDLINFTWEFFLIAGIVEGSFIRSSGEVYPKLFCSEEWVLILSVEHSIDVIAECVRGIVLVEIPTEFQVA